MCSEEMLCSKISQYFYLLNDANTDCLTPEEVSFLEGITSETPIDDISSFLEGTYKRVLLNQGESEKVYYGPFQEPGYEADSDAIAIGLKYDHFGLSTKVEKDMDRIDREEELANSIISQINSNSPFKIRVIIYDELHEKLKKNDRIVPMI